MFQNLRTGSRLWVLDKGELRVDSAEVIETKMSTSQFGVYPNSQYMPRNVDIRIKFGNEIITLKDFPGDSCSGVFGSNMFIAEAKEIILQEIENIKRNSEKILSEIDTHKDIVTKCNKVLAEHSPDIQRDIERSREIDALKDDIGNMRRDFADIKELLSKILKPKKEDKQ